LGGIFAVTIRPAVAAVLICTARLDATTITYKITHEYYWDSEFMVMCKDLLDIYCVTQVGTFPFAQPRLVQDGMKYCVRRPGLVEAQRPVLVQISPYPQHCDRAPPQGRDPNASSFEDQ
jgi:hypothetical protein